jgi:AraC family transcriptional regulator of adaptative response/methylated-DNA-[protein]-cysteine methyltransferase
MTPSAYKRGGLGETIYYEIAKSPLGILLVAGTEKGLCCIRFGEARRTLLHDLQQGFPRARLIESGPVIRPWIEALTAYLEGKTAWPRLPIDVCGTAFQAKVWEALRSIPAGVTATYSDIAATIGRPSATRAVARACATNNVALAIPCHRVVPKTGGTGGYRWGPKRKANLLVLEKRQSKLKG